MTRMWAVAPRALCDQHLLGEQKTHRTSQCPVCGEEYQRKGKMDFVVDHERTEDAVDVYFHSEDEFCTEHTEVWGDE